MTSRRALAALVIIAVAVFPLSGCGDSDQVIVYKQGKYQGKPDTQPWDNDKFKGNQVEWENAIKTRNQAQNEYTRTE